MTKTCDNLSVGILITNAFGDYLMIDRATAPVGLAPVAGHIDDHGGPEQAAHMEAEEEVGLRLDGLTVVRTQWRTNRCRRRPGPAGPGHWWTIYTACALGTLRPNAREVRDVRWLPEHTLQPHADRTIAYARGEITDTDFARRPGIVGIEPAWITPLSELGVIDVSPADLELIDRLASRPIPAAHLA